MKFLKVWLVTLFIYGICANYSTIKAADFPDSLSENGYWKLYKTKFDIFSDIKSTNWVKINDGLKGTRKWVDGLNIEHTVSCSFDWNKPSSNLIPGDEIKLDGSYTNNEYSTPQKVVSGIHIMMEKNSKNIEILDIRKSDNVTDAETKSGYIVIPAFKECNRGEIHLIVNCYIEKDFYTTTYIYVWVESATN